LPILLAAVVGATEAGGKEKVHIEYAVGRRASMTALMGAEKQLEKGDLENARRSVDAILQSDPKFWPALFTRAKIYKGQHKWQLAIQDCNELLRQYPYMVEAAVLRASINAGLGNYAASLKELDHVVSIRPRTDGLARALAERAWLRLTCRDRSFQNPQQALKDATLACNLMQWKDEDMIDTLALAYAEAGDFDSAVRYEEQALGVKGISAETSKILQQHLALFRERRPFWQSP
jgi:tetratricopeptide (TPR) repeat protein